MAGNQTHLERMHRERERLIEVPDDDGNEDRIKILVRRVTFQRHVVLVNKARAGEIGPREILSEWVKGWQGMRENDLYKSGSDDEADFELEAALDWIEDRVQVQNKVLSDSAQIMDAFVEGRKEFQGN